MQMQNQQKVNNKIKKSQTLIFGSLLVFGGIVFLSWNYFLRMRDEVYSDMRISMMDQVPPEPQQIVTDNNEIIVNDQPVVEEQQQNYTVDYSKYLGVLQKPKKPKKTPKKKTDTKKNKFEGN